MRNVWAESGNTLPIGRAGEHCAQQILFNLRTMAEKYGEGTPLVVFKPPGASDAYPVIISVEESTLRWIITIKETATPGNGSAELRWYVGAACAKTEIFETCTEPAIKEDGEYPEQFDDWISRERKFIEDYIIEHAAGAIQSIESAGESCLSDISGAATKTLNDIETTRTQAVKSVQGECNTSLSSIKNKTAESEKTISDKKDLAVREIGEKAQDAVNSVASALEAANKNFSDKFNAAMKELSDSLNAATKNLSDKMDEIIRAVENKAAEEMKKLDEDARVSEITRLRKDFDSLRLYREENGDLYEKEETE